MEREKMTVFVGCTTLGFLTVSSVRMLKGSELIDGYTPIEIELPADWHTDGKTELGEARIVNDARNGCGVDFKMSDDGKIWLQANTADGRAYLPCSVIKN